MLKLRHPPSRFFAVLIFLVALGEIALWNFLLPSTTMAQQAETPTPSPPRATPPRATPTPGVTVITPTPQPPDVFAAATQSVRLTEQAQREGTPTPLPRHLRIATRTPTPRVVTATPTAANEATATHHALHATAIAFTTGTPYVLVATATYTPTPTPTDFIVTPTPRPENIFVEATRKAEREVLAEQGQLPTPLPEFIVVATVTQTPRIVTNTPPPENDATATVYALHATAVAYTTGVPNVVTATPTPVATSRRASPAATPDPESILAEQAKPTESPTPKPTLAPTAIPTAVPTATPAVVVAEEAEFARVTRWVETYRIRFRRGMTSATIQGYIDDDQPARFVLHARAGQLMTVSLSNAGNHVARVDIRAEDGEWLGSAYAGETWRGTLPYTQLYYLILRVPVGGTGHDFSLWVDIVP